MFHNAKCVQSDLKNSCRLEDPKFKGSLETQDKLSTVSPSKKNPICNRNVSPIYNGTFQKGESHGKIDQSKAKSQKGNYQILWFRVSSIWGTQCHDVSFNRLGQPHATAQPPAAHMVFLAHWFYLGSKAFLLQISHMPVIPWQLRLHTQFHVDPVRGTLSPQSKPATHCLTSQTFFL